MKIFFGTQEIASIISDVSAGLKSLGHEVHTCLWSEPKLYKYNKYDEYTDIVENMKSFRKFQSNPLEFLYYDKYKIDNLYNYFTSYDLYIFQFGRSYIGNLEEIEFLKNIGKKVICIFNGSDVRVHDAFIQFSELNDFDPPPLVRETSDDRGLTMNQKLKILRLAERSADTLWGSMGCMTMAVRPFFESPPTIRQDVLTYRIPARERPLVVHAPTAPKFKGTEKIIESVEALKSEGYQFDFEIIQNRPNKEVLEILRDTDIVIDQLFNLKPARLAAEAMYCGCAVITGLRSDIVPVQEGSAPVEAANARCFKDQLARLIVDRERRVKMAEAAHLYAARNYGHVKRAQDILDSLDRAKTNDFDVWPRFYIDDYIPREADPVNAENRELTRQILMKHQDLSPQEWERLSARHLI
ncbi:hypothetical protein [Yunchengibacter salinarum]|uniref:hypothetical protein n=1 Tax=Yunchengibacter salinarum TaxID=3133399 RepID=UPI0035B58889